MVEDGFEASLIGVLGQRAAVTGIGDGSAHVFVGEVVADLFDQNVHVVKQGDLAFGLVVRVQVFGRARQQQAAAAGHFEVASLDLRGRGRGGFDVELRTQGLAHASAGLVDAPAAGDFQQRAADVAMPVA